MVLGLCVQPGQEALPVRVELVARAAVQRPLLHVRVRLRVDRRVVDAAFVARSVDVVRALHRRRAVRPGRIAREARKAGRRGDRRRERVARKAEQADRRDDRRVGEAAVALVERVFLVVVGVEQDVPAILGEVAPAAGHGDVDDVAAAIAAARRRAVVGGSLEALVVLAQDEVDHARDGVGTVDRGGAVLQHFDALDRAERDRRQVGRLAVQLVAGEARQAPAVDQDQRARAAEAAQRGRLQAEGRRADHGAGVEVARARRGGHVLQQVLRRRDAGLRDLLAREHRHRQRAFDVDPLDVRAGDLDADVLRERRRSGDDRAAAQCQGERRRELLALKCHVGTPRKKWCLPRATARIHTTVKSYPLP